MIRDIEHIKRDLEKKENNDIIRKKNLILEMFRKDPDLMEVLGRKEKQPLNRFSDPENPTEEELAKRKEILEYNEMVQKDLIVPYLKLNELQKEVNNYVLFDIDDVDISYTNKIIKVQRVTVMCVVHENDMETPFGIVRTDLLSYIIKDLLCWTNNLGMQLKCIGDRSDIVDSKYYCRTLRFEIQAPNVVNGHMGMSNKYDSFQH